MRRLACRLFWVASIYSAGCASIAWNTIRAKHHHLSETPSVYNLPYEAVSFTSADGTRLSGWLVKQPRSPNGLVILCHGIDSDRTAMLSTAVMLHNHGFSVLLFDFRAFGESGGSVCTLGYRETEDVLAAVQYARSRPDCRDMKIGLLGASMGGASVIMAASRSRDVSAVAAESPFSRLTNMVDHRFRSVVGPFTPLVALPVGWFGGLMIGRSPASIAPIRDIAAIAPRPLLIIEDGNDAICPASETQALFRAAREPKEFWRVEGASHCAAEMTAPKEYENRIVGLYKRM